VGERRRHARLSTVLLPIWPHTHQNNGQMQCVIPRAKLTGLALAKKKDANDPFLLVPLTLEPNVLVDGLAYTRSLLFLCDSHRTLLGSLVRRWTEDGVKGIVRGRLMSWHRNMR
jgi:hypothetical protein